MLCSGFSKKHKQKQNSIGFNIGYPTMSGGKPLLLLIASLQIQQRGKRKGETTWSLHNKHRLPRRCVAAGAGFYSSERQNPASCHLGASRQVAAAAPCRGAVQTASVNNTRPLMSSSPATSSGRVAACRSSERLKSHAAPVMSRAIMCRSCSERLPGCDGQPLRRLCFLITHAEGVESH